MGVVASTAVTGCSDPLGSAGAGGEGDTVEMLVENRTEGIAEVGVRVEDDDGDTAFSRVYELEPRSLDSSAELETVPSTVTAFTAEGRSATWEYAPDLEMNCDGEDIGLTVQPDGSIDPWYAC